MPNKDSTIEKTYNPSQIEKKWNSHWCYKTKIDQSKPSYCLMLPPPNVTGSLHMGHGFQQTLMDIQIRYHQMIGENTFWQAGTDHAGIATQMVVERQLIQTTGETRHNLGRDAFTKKVWDWKDKYGEQIITQMKRLGTAIDWSSARFTMDEHMSKATIHAFVTLYRDGLIYQGKKLTNWDPVLKTALSDLEVEQTESKGCIWHINYPLADDQDTFFTIATTRPETMLGDVAVAVHPEDERYQHLIGKEVLLPIANRAIPIIADTAVDREFGTGCLKITPAHDFTDHEIGQRHQLVPINILNLDATLNENVPDEYRGLDTLTARKKIVDALNNLNLLVATKDHMLSIPKGDRSGAIIEPLLTNQWFIKMESLASPALDALKTKKFNFIPGNWDKTYNQWLENIQDWCISRQLWWGHRLPVWHDAEGNHYVGYNEDDARLAHSLANDVDLKQSSDVLDTWFSSSLWPFATLGWPEKTEFLDQFFPTQTLMTGFDIIFFWVARMVMMSLYFTKQIPFSDVYITGLIRDPKGHKMSKTKGNVLDPLDIIDGIALKDLIDKRVKSLINPKLNNQVTQATKKQFPNGIPAYGTDALRFSFCAMASTGRDIQFDLKRIEGYRNFCNKIWNATRFVFMHATTNMTPLQVNDLSLPNRWILSKTEKLLQDIKKHLDNYRFDLLAKTLYEFTWHHFCDWFLEFSKCIFNSTDPENDLHQQTQSTALTVLSIIIRALHPIMPYLTDEIWQTLSIKCNFKQVGLFETAFPTSNPDWKSTTAEKNGEIICDLITAIRQLRAEICISPASRIPLYIVCPENARTLIEDNDIYIKNLAKIDAINWTDSTANLPTTVTAIIYDYELHIPLSGLIDPDQALKQLQKRIEKLTSEAEKSKNKLNNKGYTSKAPVEVIKKEKDRYAEISEAIDKLAHHSKKISTLI